MNEFEKEVVERIIDCDNRLEVLMNGDAYAKEVDKLKDEINKKQVDHFSKKGISPRNLVLSHYLASALYPGFEHDAQGNYYNGMHVIVLDTTERIVLVG